MLKRIPLALALALLVGCDRSAQPRDYHCSGCECFGYNRPVQVVTTAIRSSSASDMSKASTPTANVSIKRMKVTAYCTCSKCCGSWADGITASGKRAEGKLIAADRQYPFGTMMDVPGYGLASVEDRGGAIKGDKLDLLFPSHDAALQWGVRWLDVKIYPKK